MLLFSFKSEKPRILLIARNPWEKIYLYTLKSYVSSEKIREAYFKRFNKMEFINCERMLPMAVSI